MLEQGAVVFLPNLSFPVESSERDIFSPAILSSSKNASYDPATDRVGGTTLEEAERDHLRMAIKRFSDAAASLVDPASAPGRISDVPDAWRPDPACVVERESRTTP